MRVLLIMDKEYQTEIFSGLKETVLKFFRGRGCEMEIVEIGREDLAFCKGCFGCWVKKPGECVIGDRMGAINRSYVNSDVTVYLIPIVFGQFSPNIKNVLDRSLPNILPFFTTRPDGSSAHPPRYESYPRQIMIGYVTETDQEDKKLFLDIILKHRRNSEVLIYSGQADDAPLTQSLNRIGLVRMEDML